MTEGFVYLDAVLPRIFWDAKYATEDNFTGSVVEGYQTNRIVGSREMAEALLEAVDLAAQQGFGLFFWDGYRPQRAVDCFLRWADSPEDGKTKARHYPRIEKRDMVRLGYVAPKSGHSRGSAVDLTLCGLDGTQMAQMGGGFDLMDIVSHHGAKDVSAEASGNREILRRIMEKCGFNSYEKEWWHYSLKNEPYPDRYFDFPVE